MPLATVHGVLRLTFPLLAIISGGLVWGMRTSLSDLENQMMHNGSLMYSLLSSTKTTVLFRDYITTYSRKYATVKDSNERYKFFKDNLKQVDRLNANAKAENSTVVFGINKFSDLSPQEFDLKYLGVKMPQDVDRELMQEIEVEAFTGESKSVDWSGILTTPVKDQGVCGTCWAFSALEQIESDAIKAGIITPNDPLSVQQLAQCTYDVVSCDDGGYPTQAISYVSRTGGVTYDSDYPYNSTSKKCDKTKTNYAVSVTTWNFVIGLQKMIDHVLNRNTLAVLLDSKNMQAYESGIFPVSNCVAEQANHAAQIVGVNVEGGYWIVRNTWGTGWGEKGYMKLELSRTDNTCKVGSFPIATTVTSAKGTKSPSSSATSEPSQAPLSISRQPNAAPAVSRTLAPTPSPIALTISPTVEETSSPSFDPTSSPIAPTASPVDSPVVSPVPTPVRVPTPNRRPSRRSRRPSKLPKTRPTLSPEA